MNKTTVQKVQEFHETFEHPVGTLSGKEPLNIRQLRIKLLFEEVAELAEAGDVIATMETICHKYISDIASDNGQPNIDGDNVNRIEELDALCDIQYVLDGKKLTSGLHEVFDEGFDLIHSNNMNKAHASEQHALDTAEINGMIGWSTKEKDGKILLFNASGKLIKPHDHKKVTLNHLIHS